MDYFLIGDEDALLGFGMVGVDGVMARNAEETRHALHQALENPDIGIILINENLASLIREEVDRYVFTREFPLILEIPDRLGKREGQKGLRDMVNEAIGIKL